ncbi:MAG: DUF1800 family protein, partial [Planctomycetota bacterium]|nr:DUF1800 family protein [Planctomycetota bacterium]
QGLKTLPIIQRILSSNLFFSRHALARKVKSPVDLAVGFLRALSGTTNFVKLAQDLGELGQDLFFPPNVKGWDGGRAWINSSTLLGRANLIKGLLDSGATRFNGGSLRDFLTRQGASDSQAIVNRLEELLFAVPLPPAARAQTVELIDRQTGDREKHLRDALHLVCTLPEFQLA